MYYFAEGVVQVREIEERKRLYRGEEAVLPCWGRSSGTLSCKESMALFRFSYNTTRATVWNHQLLEIKFHCTYLCCINAFVRFPLPQNIFYSIWEQFVVWAGSLSLSLSLPPPFPSPFPLFFIFLQKLLTTVFSHRKIRLLSPGNASCACWVC